MSTPPAAADASEESSVANTTYAQGHTDAVIASHAARTVENSAQFLVPLLKETDRILDVGCGPGSITAGLAGLVPRGSAHGIDLSASVLGRARTSYPVSTHPNLSFAPGDILSPLGLPHPSGSFTVVFTSQTILHLPDPVRAMREAHRLLAPGGILAMRETQGFSWYPPLPGLELYDRALREVLREAGSVGTGEAARMKAWAREAGFENVRMTGGSMVFDSEDERMWWASVYENRLRGEIGDKMKEVKVLWPGKETEGLRDVGKEGVEMIRQDVERWSADANGWFCAWQCEVIAKKSDACTT